MNGLFPKGFARMPVSRGENQYFLLWRPWAIVSSAALVGLALAVSVLSLGTGYADVGRADILAYFLGETSQDTTTILGQLRLPRIILALVCGAMLGLAGAAMQSATRNPLADPGLIGVKEGALVALLIAGVIWPSFDPAWRPIIGLTGGALTFGCVTILARTLSGLKFILVGIGTSWMLASGISLYMTAADPADAHSALVWMSGSLHAVGWPAFWAALPFALIAGGTLFALGRSGNIAELGHTIAHSLGLNIGRLAFLRISAAVVLTTTATATIGGLGFVGLIAPHIATVLIGARQTALLCGSMIIGAFITLTADTIGRSAFAPLQIPAGVIIAFVGAPFFLFLLWKRRGRM